MKASPVLLAASLMAMEQLHDTVLPAPHAQGAPVASLSDVLAQLATHSQRNSESTVVPLLELLAPPPVPLPTQAHGHGDGAALGATSRFPASSPAAAAPPSMPPSLSAGAAAPSSVSPIATPLSIPLSSSSSAPTFAPSGSSSGSSALTTQSAHAEATEPRNASAEAAKAPTSADLRDIILRGRGNDVALADEICTLCCINAEATTAKAQVRLLAYKTALFQPVKTVDGTQYFGLIKTDTSSVYLTGDWITADAAGKLWRGWLVAITHPDTRNYRVWLLTTPEESLEPVVVSFQHTQLRSDPKTSRISYTDLQPKLMALKDHHTFEKPGDVPLKANSKSYHSLPHF